MSITDSNHVAVGKPDLEVSGGLLVAPIGTTRPASYDDTIDPAYVSVGYVGDDGATESTERDVEDIKAWGGIRVRTVQTDHSSEVSLTLIESTNAETLRLVYGDDNVTVDGDNISVRRNAKELPKRQFLIPMLDGNNSRILDIGRGQVTETGDVTYVDGEAISYEITITCEPDENNDTIVEHIQDPTFVDEG